MDLKFKPNHHNLVVALNTHFGRKITKGEAITLSKITKQFGLQQVYDLVPSMDKNTAVTFGSMGEQIIALLDNKKIEKFNINESINRTAKFPMESDTSTPVRRKKSISN